MTNKLSLLSPDTLKKLGKIKYKAELQDEGQIVSLYEGVAWLKGLSQVMYGEVIIFKNSVYGLVLNLEEDKVGTIILGDFENLSIGDTAVATKNLLEIGVSEKILGRVIDPLGNFLDSKKKIKVDKYMPVEKIAPGIIDRSPVNQPLQTGILSVDAMIPIGRGQRELIIGDRGTGKTALAVDAIINQKDSDVICIYVAIGQKRAKIAQIIEKLSEHKVLEKTVVVSASASDSASLRYTAPYVGCAIGEYFMEKGKDVLVVYDDLTKHAWAYRELSLLLNRPSGREAYPGDVFYLHSRLLERACKLAKNLGGGSLTALPIIETQAGDVSAYIPTNVISITDGQIYLEGDLFFAGVRPALNVGLSVSRIGGTAQIKAMKNLAGSLRLDLTQFWELETFAQFSTDLDTATREKIDRGKRIVELLKQAQYRPLSVEMQVVILYSAATGKLDDIPVESVRQFKNELMKIFKKKHNNLLGQIAKTKEIDKKLEKKLDKAILEFSKLFRRENIIDDER